MRSKALYIASSLKRVLVWIGGHELPVMVALLIVAGTVWGFAELADEVLEGETRRFDEQVLKWLRRADDPRVPIGPGWLKETARDLTALGGISVLTLVVLIVAGFLWLQRLYGAMALLLIATLGGMAVSLTFKSLFGRPRPTVVPHLADVSTASFPSGHSMASAVVYLTLGVLLSRVMLRKTLTAYCLIVAILLTVIVGLTRIYLGVHYPTDVVGGWAAGLAWALVCWLIARYLQRRGAVEEGVDPGMVKEG